MSVHFGNYTAEAGITADYHKVRAFLVQLGHTEFTYTRWDWMTTHRYLNTSAVGKIGLWEAAGELVGLATFDTDLGDAFCLTLPEYAFLKREMLLYARDNLAKDGNFRVVISDRDLAFQDIAAELGFIATDKKESDAVFYLDKSSTDYRLPAGFRITTLQESYDLYQYCRVLWKGFNHELNGEGELQFSKAVERAAADEMERPHVDLSLKVAVLAPDGNFVSYCGLWYEPQAGFAVIEPVATDPGYRKLGLGKAAVLEGVRRVGVLGAKTALVGSSQQFYYSIGFRPFTTATCWRPR